MCSRQQAHWRVSRFALPFGEKAKVRREEDEGSCYFCSADSEVSDFESLAPNVYYFLALLLSPFQFASPPCYSSIDGEILTKPFDMVRTKMTTALEPDENHPIGSPTYICKLPEESRRCAEEELGEDPDLRADCIRELQEWLREKAAYLNARNDDLSLLKFLRGCKFDRQMAQKKLRNFYEMKRAAPEWYSDRDPMLPELQEILRIGSFLPVPEKTDKGEQVMLIRATVHDPRKHKQDDVFKVSNMIVDLLWSQDEMISVHGVIAVVDLKGVTLNHALQMTPSMIRKAVHAWQDCYPIRIKSMNFINSPSYVDVVLNIFRRFMSKKMSQRVFVHGYNTQSFHKVVSPKILPKEYGGTKGNIADLIVRTKTMTTEKRLWFLDDEKYKPEETSGR